MLWSHDYIENPSNIMIRDFLIALVVSCCPLLPPLRLRGTSAAATSGRLKPVQCPQVSPTLRLRGPSAAANRYHSSWKTTWRRTAKTPLPLLPLLPLQVHPVLHPLLHCTLLVPQLILISLSSPNAISNSRCALAHGIRTGFVEKK